MRAMTAAILLASLAESAVGAEPFELAGWEAQPARRTVWTRWLSTFDFRKGAGDPDYYRGIYFMACRPGNYRTMATGRFGEAGAPLYTVRDKRTQMTYHLDANCGSWQATVELFVRSKAGINLWNDGKAHHVLHLFGARSCRQVEGRPAVSLIKTAKNVLMYQCQGTTLSLPVEAIKAEQWVHVAISWDAKTQPGRIWLTLDGKGLTTEAVKPLQAVSYGFLVLGNAPRDADKANTLARFGEANVARLTQDGAEDKDVFPLEGVVDEIHISDETLADRTPQARAQLKALPVDWSLYRQVEDMVRMLLYRLWPNDLPFDTQLGGKYGGAVRPGWFHLAMYEAFGDLWFLHQAERVGEILLMAQGSAGQFPTAIRMTSSGKAPHELAPTETGIKSVGPASWSKPNHARIQDGFQDVPMAYLIYLYRLTGRKAYLDAARRVGDLFIAAQNPNGSWSGLYDVEIKKSRIADSPGVLQGGEFDDGGVRRPFWSLLLLYHATQDAKYLAPLVKCADWIWRAEIVGSGARGWAAFYDAANRPVQARAHELPKISPKVFPQDVGHLMIWSTLLTGERKYLDALRPALKWYQQHRTARGWPAFYENDGTPITPSNWYSGAGWYGPAYGHFKDITYIAEAIDRLDKGQLRPQTGSLKPSPDAIGRARAAAVERLGDPELLRWVRRDVQLAPQAQWVRYRPRYRSQLYGIQAHGDLEKMIAYLVAVRIAANKAPPSAALTGAPMPDGAPLTGLRARCWFVEDWFDTPLRGRR